MEWSDTYAPTCSYCRAKSAERTPPGTPPCESCRVELREDNEEAAAVFMMARDQVITALSYNENGAPYSRVVGLSLPAVESAMRIIGVKDQRTCLAKVRRAFWHFQNEGES